MSMARKSDTFETRSGQGFAAQGDAGRALAHAGEAWLSVTTECNRELVGFVSRRIEKDGETVREMMGSGNLAEATAIQARWLQDTLQDYNAEMTKLMAICRKSMDGTRG
jgi:hypothetical protein